MCQHPYGAGSKLRCQKLSGSCCLTLLDVFKQLGTTLCIAQLPWHNHGCRKKAKLREICQYCNKTSHASEDCPIKLAAEEGYASEDAVISASEDAEDDAEPESSSDPETARHQPASTTGTLPARANSYSPEVQVSRWLLSSSSAQIWAMRGSVLKGGGAETLLGLTQCWDATECA